MWKGWGSNGEVFKWNEEWVWQQTELIWLSIQEEQWEDTSNGITIQLTIASRVNITERADLKPNNIEHKIKWPRDIENINRLHIAVKG